MIDREKKLIILSKYERTCDMNDISVNIFQFLVVLSSNSDSFYFCLQHMFTKLDNNSQKASKCDRKSKSGQFKPGIITQDVVKIAPH